MVSGTATPDPRPWAAGGSARPARMTLALGLAGIVAAAVWVIVIGRRAQPSLRQSGVVKLLTVDRPFPAGGRFESDRYVGSPACSECHPGEAALYARSGHASTLRTVGGLPLSRKLDGKTVYACTARLEPREMTLAPLSNKPLLRDLVTEIAPPAERLS